MGILFRASSKVENFDAAASFQIAIPALTDTDIMVMVVYGKHGTNPETLTTPAGWTLLGSDPIQFDQGRFATYFKRKVSAEPAADLVFGGVMDACYAVLAGFYDSEGGQVDVYDTGKSLVSTPNAALAAIYPACTPFVAEADAHLLLGSTSATDGGAGLSTVTDFTKVQAIADTGSGVDEGAACIQYDLAGSAFGEKTVNDAAVGYHGTQSVALTVSGGVAGGGGQAAVAAASSAW